MKIRYFDHAATTAVREEVVRAMLPYLGVEYGNPSSVYSLGRKNKKIVLTAILLAMLVLLSRFLSIKTPITKISFAFVPTMLCAIWLGPKWTIICITNLADEILIADRTLILDNGKIALER